ncbi:MazG-like family protein [Galactobacillus timonensis]|uniref:MazG-like family protein n=1 Tax=Galactobacillus timonensis TaxID=2041840 RepID=UPI000C8251B3|nr:MazG-like family protein [Galactobacillus timonensis]MDD6680674.1 MazG-like family protein [Galactobacillus timonensis]
MKETHDKDYYKTQVAEKLADVLNYCILMADKLGVDLDQIVQDKLAINAKKYPVEKAKGTSKKYSEL